MYTKALKATNRHGTLKTVNRVSRKNTITAHKNVSNKKKHKNKEIVDAT
jgi:hypothetical protein